MATITLRYNKQNALATCILNSIRMAGVFEIIDSQDYDTEFVNKIQESDKQFAEGRYKQIETADLWK
jgi:hypothetical protein